MKGEIKEVLAKVLNLTNSPNEAEARAAAEHLQRLLVRFNLDIADLEMKGHAKKPDIKEDDHDLGKAAFKWKLNLADALAEHYFCVSLTDHYTKTVRFAGRPDNVAALKSLYVWIIDQVARIAREDRRRHIEDTGEHIDPLRWQVNFGLGAVGRLHDRLVELKEKQSASVTETGLVTSHAAEVSDYLEDKYGYRKDGRRTKQQEKYWRDREDREKEWQELKVKDPAAYYEARPWERPETPEQKALREREEAKDEKRREKNRKRREEREWTERPRSAESIFKEEQGYRARAAGRKGADKVNLEPWLEGGKRKKEIS